MTEGVEDAKETSSREQALEKFRKEAREYAVQAELDPERVAHWEGKAREIFETYGKDFSSFVEEHEKLVREGEKVIREIATTGFNVSYILEKDDFPFESNKALIFYNNSIDIPEHFGLVLAEMEREMEKNEPISEDQIRFSKKATEVIAGEWKDINVPEDTYVLAREDGSRVQIGRTVETVVIFSVRNDDQAIGIIDFLFKKTKRGRNSIPGSFSSPDIRVSRGFEIFDTYKRYISEGKLVSIISNTLKTEEGKLIVLRESTKFDQDEVKRNEGWRSLNTGVNKDLAQYVLGFGVGP